MKLRSAASALLAALMTACAASPPAGSPARTELLVSAAASLTDAFQEVELAFEAANPEVEVVLNLGGSSALREQILEGAPVDVFASADRSNMQQLAEGGELAGEARTFARNRLQIAVPAGNPAGVTGLGDFSNQQLLIGLCAPGVPCGDFARQALAKAGVTPAVDTNEPDVRSLLTKIELDELDAGITYVTDVTAAASTVEGIEIPERFNVTAEYPIAVLGSAPHPQLAAAWVGFVLSADGQAILAGYGFEAP